MENHETPQALLEKITMTCGGGNYIFRGENSLYGTPVSSTIYRKYGVDEESNLFNSHYQPVHIEEEIVERAKKAQFTPETTNAKVLTELRHFGAHTTLIDFSHSLFVALFFACNGEHDKDGCVYALDTSGIQTLEDIDYEKQRNNLGIALLDPIRTPLSQARTQAQSSVFVHAPRGKVVKEDGLLCFPVPEPLREKCLEYLKRLDNISVDTIYNDLIGFITNERNFDSAQHSFYLGNAKAELGHHEEAIKDYNKAIELIPSYLAAWNNRGLAKAGFGDHEEAIKDYNKAIELNPNYPHAWSNRGIAKAERGQPKEAIKDFDQAIKLNPDAAPAWNNRGNEKAKLDHHEDAIKDFNQAIELNPSDPGTWYNRGNTKAKFGQQEEAIKDYNKAIELNPNDPNVWINRGIAKRSLGQYEEAIKDYNKAIVLDGLFLLTEFGFRVAPVVPGTWVAGVQFDRLVEVLDGILVMVEFGLLVAPVVPGWGGVGVQFDGLVEVLDGLFRLAAFGLRDAPVAPGMWVVGVQFDGLVVVFDGLFVLA